MRYAMNTEEDTHIRNLAKQVVAHLQSAGFTAFWAGGCVRDVLMGRTPKDYDIATSATPDQIIALFPGSVEVGKSFGVVRAPMDSVFFEVATFRRDHDYKDGRRPESVSFTDPETDALRRDFTINAMFYDPATDELHDFVGGRNDIAARLIRCVGNPTERFREDHLRILRAARFASVLDFAIEPATASAISSNSSLIYLVSPERIRDELTRIFLESKRPGDALPLLDNLALLVGILPEIAAMKNVEQPAEFHPEGDVFTHTIAMLNLMESPTAVLAYSVLLHDVGKPPTFSAGPDRIRFHCHAERGAEIAEAVLRRLHFSSDDIEAIVHCVRNHMRFGDATKMRRATLRKLIGAATFTTELELHRLDCIASHGKLSNWDFLLDFRKQLADEPVLPTAWITGKDILDLGIPEGSDVGMWKKRAYDAQLEQRFASRNDLLDWLRKEIKPDCTP
jgi:poly(A) polymerase